jgi:hypothetical protein
MPTIEQLPAKVNPNEKNMYTALIKAVLLRYAESVFS